jgi:hypothetical protein
MKECSISVIYSIFLIISVKSKAKMCFDCIWSRETEIAIFSYTHFFGAYFSRFRNREPKNVKRLRIHSNQNRKRNQNLILQVVSQRIGRSLCHHFHCRCRTVAQAECKRMSTSLRYIDILKKTLEEMIIYEDRPYRFDKNL